MRYLLAAATSAAFLSGEAFCQSGPADQPIFSISPLGYHSSFYINVSDQVDDGCWTNVDQARSRIRYLLETNNFSVLERTSESFSNVWSPTIEVSLLGYGTGSGCVVGVKYQVFYMSVQEYGEGSIDYPNFTLVSTAVSYDQFNLLSGSRPQNNPILQVVTSHTETLIADILSARREPDYQLFLERLAEMRSGD